jgi:hypothetical protein
MLLLEALLVAGVVVHARLRADTDEVEDVFIDLARHSSGLL